MGINRISNTATPKYYGEFREAVLRGDIPVNKEIEMQMNRIDERIQNKNFYYDPEPVEAYIRFCENELTLTDGSDLKLLPSFKLWAEDLYGWYYFDRISVYEPFKDNHGGRYVNKTVKHRLTRKQFLIVGRGGAKSLYDETIQAKELTVNPSTTHQITVAPTMRQADEVMAPFRTAIVRSRGPFFKFMTLGSIQNTTGSKENRQKLASTKKGIENMLTNSLLEVRPMSIDKLQGLRVKVATLDEWLSGDIREDPIGAIEQGAAKINDYIIIATSSEGTVRNGPGDSIKMELMSILKGEYYAPHVSIWWYKLDDISEVGNPEMWMKAQPNIGKTVSYKTYQEDVDKMENAPASRNDILAKRFGIPTEGYTYFFSYEQTIPHKKKQTFWQMPCTMGADLSRGDDFCAFTFLFPIRKGVFGVKTRCYISEKTMKEIPPAMRTKYESFLKEGSLVVMDGTVLDMMEVYDELDEYIERNEYQVIAFGYDPYNSEEFVKRWIEDNGSYAVEKVAQGARTESVPLGELRDLADERALIFDQSIMQFCMGNCITLEDTNGNRKLLKLRNDKKIDSVAAMMDAYVVYKLYSEDFD